MRSRSFWMQNNLGKKGMDNMLSIEKKFSFCIVNKAWKMLNVKLKVSSKCQLCIIFPLNNVMCIRSLVLLCILFAGRWTLKNALQTGYYMSNRSYFFFHLAGNASNMSKFGQRATTRFTLEFTDKLEIQGFFANCIDL